MVMEKFRGREVSLVASDDMIFDISYSCGSRWIDLGFLSKEMSSSDTSGYNGTAHLAWLGKSELDC